MSLEATMLLISFNAPGVSTFKLIPIKAECPYQEAFYVVSNKVLAIVSTHQRHQVSEGKKGEIVYSAKSLPVEYHITDNLEISSFIQRVAVNAKEFDYNRYLTGELKPTISISK